MRFHQFILLESQQKLDFFAKQFGLKLLNALMYDNTPPAKKLKKEAGPRLGQDKELADEDKKVVEDLIKELAKIDPTGERHDMTQWIIRMYIGHQARNDEGAPTGPYVGEFKLEDADRIKKDLESFIKFKSKIANKDLNSYKKITDFYDVVEKAEEEFDPEAAKSKKQQVRDIKMEGVDVIIQTPGLKVVHVKTEEAAKFYGSNTKWCTTSGAFRSYSDDLMIIMVKEGNRKFQFHYKSKQVMDEKDQSIVGKPDVIALLSRTPGWKEFLNLMIEKYYSPHLNKNKK